MDVAALILAGGKGARMGTDKALATFRGVPLVDRALSLASKVASRALVASGSRDLPGRACIRDQSDGPLAAMLHGAEALDAEWILVLPCDMPLLDAAALRSVLDAAAGRDGAVARVGGWPQMLVGAYRRDALLREAGPLVAAGERGPKALAGRMDLAFVDFGADDPRMRDADTPAELEQLEKLAR